MVFVIFQSLWTDFWCLLFMKTTADFLSVFGFCTLRLAFALSDLVNTSTARDVGLLQCLSKRSQLFSSKLLTILQIFPGLKQDIPNLGTIPFTMQSRAISKMLLQFFHHPILKINQNMTIRLEDNCESEQFTSAYFLQAM